MNRITWTHHALAVADRHSLNPRDRISAELHAAGHFETGQEIIITPADVLAVLSARIPSATLFGPLVPSVPFVP